MPNNGYLRHPSLHGDTTVFVSDDDLWRVSASGGVARRLTAGLSEPSTPCLSADGQWIAFVGRDEQHPEVYLMSAEGGPARRMTWLGPDVIVRGWTPEGHILFVSTYGQPFFRNYRAYTLDPAGGTPQLLSLGQVNHLAFGPGKIRVIGRNTADPARWKRYRGGTAGHLWIDADGTGTYRRMTELGGNITSPMWLDGRVYYLSDMEGVGNLYSCLPDGSDVRRHSDHDDYYARHAHTDGRRIVYQCGAELWLFDPGSDHSEQIEIQLPSHRTQAARKFVPAAEHLGSIHVHPAGHSVALDARGKLFSFALWEGAVRQHGDDHAGPTATWAMAGRWLDDRGRQRRLGGRARRGIRKRPRAFAALGHRPRRRHARRAARPSGRAHESPQRSDDRRSRQWRPHDHRSQRCGPHRRPRVVRRWRVARIHILDIAAPLRDQASRRRRQDEYTRYAARIPRLQPGVRSQWAISVFPVDTHLRSGVRQRAVRVELSPRGAPLPDRAAGRRAAALRSRCPRR